MPKQMGTRYRIAFLSILLLTAIGLLYIFWPVTSVGMTEHPCTAERKPVDGNPNGDWAMLCIFHDDNARLIAQGKRPRAVLIGDSLTQDWPMFAPGLFGDNLVNRGIGTQTSAQVLLRFPQDVTALRPRIVHILIGTNDVAGNTGASSPEMFMANLRAMVDLAEASGAMVILATIPPADKDFFHPRIQPGHWIAILNSRIEALASQRGLILADYRTALATPTGERIKSRYRDSLHPNAEGYAAMRRVLERALEEAEAKAVRASPPDSASRARAGLNPLP